MCIIPYGTQQGEISFCAYNTGVGWRNIIENMYKNATVGQWYREHGRHTVYADGKAMPLPSFEHQLKVTPEMMVQKEKAEELAINPDSFRPTGTEGAAH
jgi:hypothetical protein